MAKHKDSDTDEGMHDGSPMGNAYIGSKRYASLALCPDKTCPSLGFSFKCHQKCYVNCVTYRSRNDLDVEVHESDSELVVMAMDD